MCSVGIFAVWILVLSVIGPLSRAQDDRRELTVMGFLPTTGGWSGGETCLFAVNMAVRLINNRSDILPNHKLKFVWENTACHPGVAVVRMYEMLSADPVKIMVVGGGCSVETEITAQVTPLWNLTQISYGSSSPVLSDRNRFPNFFRLAVPDTEFNPPRLALMELFNWKRVATINQALDFFSMVIDDFVKSVQGTDVSIISQEIFQHDPTTRVENLKKQDARIIIVGSYQDKARLILCSAYRVGLYGPRIVWMFPGWFSDLWWQTPQDDVTCSVEQMNLAAEGAIFTSVYYKNPNQVRDIAGLTAKEFTEQIKEEPGYFSSKDDFVTGPCFDVMWAVALALNCSENKLRDQGHPKTLEEFTYQDSDMNKVITTCQSKVKFEGVSGHVQFGEGADPIRNIKIQRIQGGVKTTVGRYRVDTEPRTVEWIQPGIVWAGGHPPRDSTLVTFQEILVAPGLRYVMCTLSGGGILLAFTLFLFNVINRNNRIVKMSSPNINNILLLGCAITYSTVFMTQGQDATTTVSCKARADLFIIGFTMSFGALFSKTWRVYRIFTNKKLMKRKIKDYQLVGIVAVLVGMVLCIIIVKEVVDPQTLIVKELKQELYVSGNDAEVHPYIRVCFSEHFSYFNWTIYLLEGALITFGAFLAWETRHVKIEALNDSRQIGMCLYNVVVLGAVGLTLSLVLESQITLLYGINSGCIIIGTTATQVIVFVPKVMAVRQQNTHVDPVVPASSFANNSSVVPSRIKTLHLASVDTSTASPH